MTPRLAVEALSVRFHTDDGVVDAVENVSFQVDPGEVVCLVGETGSGKTAACEAVTRLAAGATIEGSIRFDGRELTAADAATLRSIRGDRIAHVFQQPGTSLDPVYTVGAQIAEATRLHADVGRGAARERAIELLADVGIAAPEERVDAYPHELSGGMRQRVAIAIALAADPDLLVADEPTTALDVTLQAGLLDLFRALGEERDLSILLVTHDLGVAAELADRVIVLYDGLVMERGPVDALFAGPAHPYTRRLFAASERIDDATDPAGAAADGCPFRTECRSAVAACAGDRPALYPVDDGTDSGVDRAAACVYYGPDRDPADLDGGSPG